MKRKEGAGGGPEDELKMSKLARMNKWARSRFDQSTAYYQKRQAKSARLVEVSDYMMHPD